MGEGAYKRGKLISGILQYPIQTGSGDLKPSLTLNVDFFSKMYLGTICYDISLTKNLDVSIKLYCERNLLIFSHL